MAETDSVTVTIDVDLDQIREACRRAGASVRLWVAHFFYMGALFGRSLTETAEQRNAAITDARDAYYTARDLTEEPDDRLRMVHGDRAVPLDRRSTR